MIRLSMPATTADTMTKIIEFMRGLMTGGLKDNTCLQFSVVTGILRISKESIFSGLNNLEVCTMLDKFYADKFGLLNKMFAKF